MNGVVYIRYGNLAGGVYAILLVLNRSSFWDISKRMSPTLKSLEKNIEANMTLMIK